MQFFKQIQEKLKDCKSLTISLTPKADKVTVGIFPALKDSATESIKPFTITGTVDELDAEFFNHFGAYAEEVTGIVSNLEEVKKQAEEIKEKAKKKDEKPAKAEAKKGEAKKAAPAKKQEEPESETQKPQSNIVQTSLL